MSKTPTLIWAQRVEKVFVTWECLATKEVNVTFSEGLLTVEGTLENGEVYKLENLPLFLEIEPDGSKWFKNDRCSSQSPSQLLVSGSGSSSGAGCTPPPPSLASRRAPASHIFAVPPVQVCGDLSEEEDGRVVGRVFQG